MNNLTGPRDAAYQFGLYAEQVEWLLQQVREHGSLPVYGTLDILTKHAALLRTLEAAAEDVVTRRVETIREALK